jgi:cell division protein FtsW
MRSISRKSLIFSRPNYTLLLIIFVLIVVGLVVISSASSVISLENYNDSTYLLKKQIFSVIIGLGAMWAAYRVEARIWKKFSVYLLAISIFLLLLVFVPGIGVSHGGASRWLNLGPLSSLQPSEFLKFSLIIYLASLFENKGQDIRSLSKGVLPFVAIIVVLGAILMKQPDLGTFLIVAGIAVVMFFVSGSRLKHFLGMAAIGIAGIVAVIRFEPYRMERFLVFLDPEAHSGGMGYQINQALMAIGTGGIWGLGFGQSRQKFQFLPEPATDSIFAIVAEEKGLIGAFAIVLIFIIFGYFGYKTAKNANDSFSRLLAVGITSWIIIQAFLNIFAILSLVPLTGVPLPFISYGGSSIIFMLAACGILLNISKNLKEDNNENISGGRRYRRAHLAGDRNH